MMTSKAIPRKAVPLSAEEAEAVNQAIMSGILGELTGEDVGSEASALRALVRLGLQQVRERQQINGYAAWAANMSDEDKAYRVAIRSRRRGGSE
jgi:hypothetical protein